MSPFDRPSGDLLVQVFYSHDHGHLHLTALVGDGVLRVACCCCCSFLLFHAFGTVDRLAFARAWHMFLCHPPLRRTEPVQVLVEVVVQVLWDKADGEMAGPGCVVALAELELGLLPRRLGPERP